MFFGSTLFGRANRAPRPSPPAWLFLAAMNDGPSTTAPDILRMGDAPDVISFVASKPRKHRRIARRNPLGQINRLRPLIEFDAGSPRVGDECNPDANVVHAG